VNAPIDVYNDIHRGAFIDFARTYASGQPVLFNEALMPKGPPRTEFDMSQAEDLHKVCSMRRGGGGKGGGGQLLGGEGAWEVGEGGGGKNGQCPRSPGSPTLTWRRQRTTTSCMHHGGGRGQLPLAAVAVTSL
jgi:hypothetical protein